MAADDTPHALLEKGIAALRAKDYAQSEALLRQALARGGVNAEALFYLAQGLAAGGNFTAALEAIQDSFQHKPRPETALVGAELALRLGLGDDTSLWSTRLSGLKPAHLAQLQKLAARQGAAGLYRAAANTYRAALNCAPDDFEILKTFCFYASMFDRGEVVAILESFIARHEQSPRLVSLALWLLLPHKEWELRRENGLGIYSPTFELHFRFAKAEFARWRQSIDAWLAESPNDLDAMTMMALALVARGEPMAAEPFLARVRAKTSKNPATVAHFGSGFFTMVDKSESDLGKWLPWPETLVARAPTGPSVFMGCDAAYFEKYGWTLARSFAAAPHDVFLQIHVFDLPGDQRADFLNRLAAVMGARPYGVTTETTDLAGKGEAAAIYYHAIRFVRAAQFAEEAQQPLCLIDADMVFMGAVDRAFAGLGDIDVQLLSSPGRVEISNQITACVAVINATPRGRAYLHRVAGYLATCAHRKELVWGVDQVAFYAVYAEMTARDPALRVASVPLAVHDGRFSEDTLLWASKCAPQDPRFAAHQTALAKFK